MEPISQIAAKLNFSTDDLELYGKYKTKISPDGWNKIKDNPDGKLILVTAINPTPAGEGKTTVSIGLADALQHLGLKTALALREPSLGPCFGIKGGAAGGGYAQVLPMEDINLHFTGDFHALTSANNLLAALIDNHLQQGNALRIDPQRVTWRRAVDLNDRALRHIICGLGGKVNGVPRETGFDITVASEMMAILCLADGIEDLKNRLARIVVAYDVDDKPIFARDLNATGALALLLKDAIKPNLVQTLEHTPAFIHGGPFANIAHGCNSIAATRHALKAADYVVTEAGFGADLGAEKFLDIKCRLANIAPSAVVVVATIRALKMHGGVSKNNLGEENIAALQTGFANLQKHLENIKAFGLPAVVAINEFFSDTEAEKQCLLSLCEKNGHKAFLTRVFAEGGKGAIELAQAVAESTQEKSKLQFSYALDMSIKEKIATIAQKIYGASGVSYTAEAEKMLNKLNEMQMDKLPICIAKTQYSLSDDSAKIGRPKDFTITVRELRLCAGAGFIVALTGSIMTMPGLPQKPAAENMDISADGTITGLF